MPLILPLIFLLVAQTSAMPLAQQEPQDAPTYSREEVNRFFKMLESDNEKVLIEVLEIWKDHLNDIFQEIEETWLDDTIFDEHDLSSNDGLGELILSKEEAFRKGIKTAATSKNLNIHIAAFRAIAKLYVADTSHKIDIIKIANALGPSNKKILKSLLDEKDMQVVDGAATILSNIPEAHDFIQEKLRQFMLDQNPKKQLIGLNHATPKDDKEWLKIFTQFKDSKDPDIGRYLQYSFGDKLANPLAEYRKWNGYPDAARYLIVVKIEDLKTAESEAIMRNLIRDPYGPIRSCAWSFRLSSLNETLSNSQIRTLLADPDPGVRSTVFDARVLDGRPDVTELLRLGLRDPDSGVRSRLANFITESADDSLLPDVLNVIKNGEFDSDYVNGFLAKASFDKYIDDWLTSSNTYLKLQAVYALSYREEESSQFLRMKTVVHDENPKIQEALIDYLCRYEFSETPQLLMEIGKKADAYTLEKIVTSLTYFDYSKAPGTNVSDVVAFIGQYKNTSHRSLARSIKFALYKLGSKPPPR